MLNEAIEKKLKPQQAKLGKSPAYWVGEQLKDMLRAEPWNADLVARDLDVPEMAITQVEKKIQKQANKNGGACGGAEADKIIREFYGFRSAAEDRSPARRLNRRRKSVKPSGWKITCKGGGPDDLGKRLNWLHFPAWSRRKTGTT